MVCTMYLISIIDKRCIISELKSKILKIRDKHSIFILYSNTSTIRTIYRYSI